MPRTTNKRGDRSRSSRSSRTLLVLAVEADHLSATTTTGEVLAKIQTPRDFLALVEDKRNFRLAFGSSVDFPEEDTDDPAIIRLCQMINKARAGSDPRYTRLFGQKP